MNIEELAKEGLRFDQYVQTDLIGASEKGQVFVLPYEIGGHNPVLNVNRHQYVLIGGIAGFLDGDQNIISYNSFGMKRGAISFKDLRPIQLIKTAKIGCFRDSTLTREEYTLPRRVEISSLKMVVYINYVYMIYQDMGRLEAPYDINYLSTTHVDDALKSRIHCPVIEDLRKIIIEQGISLVRFIQLLRAFKTEYNFVHSLLVEIDVEIQATKDKGLGSGIMALSKACDFIFNNALGNATNDYSFWTVLMNEEPEIGNILLNLEKLFDREAKIEENLCDGLSNKLMVYNQELLGVDCPLKLAISCHGQSNKVAIIHLRASIDSAGNITTYGIDPNPLNNGEEIAKIAYYSASPHIEIINIPIRDPRQSPMVFPQAQLLIYQHIRTEVVTPERVKDN